MKSLRNKILEKYKALDPSIVVEDNRTTANFCTRATSSVGYFLSENYVMAVKQIRRAQKEIRFDVEGLEPRRKNYIRSIAMILDDIMLFVRSEIMDESIIGLLPDSGTVESLNTTRGN